MEKVKISAVLPKDVAEILENIVDIAGYQMVVHPVKERVKKKKTLEDVINEVENRFEHSNFYVVDLKKEYNTTNIIISHPKKTGFAIGRAVCAPYDYYVQPVGTALAICRACKWKDLEQEILSNL